MNTILNLTTKHLASDKANFLNKLLSLLEGNGYKIINAHSLDDLKAIISENPEVVCLLFIWKSYDLESLAKMIAFNIELPVFALASQGNELKLRTSESDLKLNLNFLQPNFNLIEEAVLSISQAINSYLDKIVPEFTKSLINFAKKNKYAFCTPGHSGGSAFKGSPVGKIFYDFFGSNIFKADISTSVIELGSLLKHDGPHKMAEALISKAFNSDRSYIVTNGTSTSNKIVGMFCAGDGDTILVDRNCHKSICHFMLMTNVIPIYLTPQRNHYSIIGGISKAQFSKENILTKIKNSPLKASYPVYAVITNSTYDGLLYDVEYIKNNLKIKYLHFDSAWTPYANFHNIYNHKHGMSCMPSAGQVILETQSTHKLLAAFSQASMIHVKGSFDEETLNEAFMMHSSTSPFYPIVASCEVSAAMMTEEYGKLLFTKTIERAIVFRQEIKLLNQQNKDSWYYDVWQPNEDQAISQLQCWPLKQNDRWHGFKDQDDDFIFLDPIKITILTPGFKEGILTENGIPAEIIAMFLEDHSIIIEKTGTHTLLLLFNIGITEAKIKHILIALDNFKKLYDDNVTVEFALPNLYAQHTYFYAGMHIQDLCRILQGQFIKHNLPQKMYEAFAILPEIVMTPHNAYQKLIKGCTEKIRINQLENKTLAALIAPYPPGIPLIMPGERINKASYSILQYLLILEHISKEIPGFKTNIHGIDVDAKGSFYIKIIKD